MKKQQKLRVLLEMRPAMDGYAGIPQETRLLFRGLCLVDSIEVEGLLQTSLRFLSSGTRKSQSDGVVLDNEKSIRFNCYSRVVLSLDKAPSKKYLDVAKLYLKRRREAALMMLSSLIFPNSQKLGISEFEPYGFEAYVWQALFSKTLPASDFGLVTAKKFKVCTVPWNVMQSAGLYSLKFSSQAVYPKLSTKDVDVFIAQTPYPGRVDKNTALVVRYHDALPVFMPHAFANKSRHQATHFRALESNVKSGAYFACVSESTRQDLLKIFPELGERAVTIHNMISPHYFQENSSVSRAPKIIKKRLNLLSPQTHPEFDNSREKEEFYQRNLRDDSIKYILMVSTIEPRKNHSRLIAAWEEIRAELDPSIKLVIVGGLGWDVEPIIREMRTGINQGGIFVLNNVPANELRMLYRHASITVCPSLAEGFDFSGIESMCSGGITIASDIPVHREVYSDAAEYFDPYSTEDLVNTIIKVLYNPLAPQVQETLRSRGKEISLRYSPNAILPQWQEFLSRITSDKGIETSPSTK